MFAESPQIVGIVGGSCAGKSWLSEELQSFLGADTVRISLDDFYRDRSHLSPSRCSRVNYDHPRAIDWDRVGRVLGGVAAGRAVSAPRYDFASHGRLPGDRVIAPRKVVLVEGLWLFRRPSIRKLFDLRVFIRSSAELCLERRLSRDVTERGRTREQVLAQFERFTWPMFNRFVAPQEKWAHVVLDAPIGEGEVQALANRIEKEDLAMAVGI